MSHVKGEKGVRKDSKVATWLAWSEGSTGAGQAWTSFLVRPKCVTVLCSQKSLTVEQQSVRGLSQTTAIFMHSAMVLAK